MARTAKIDKINLSKFRSYKHADLNDIILAVVVSVGLIGAMAIAPNVLMVVNKYQKFRQMYKKQSYINKRLKRLIKKGLIKENISDDGWSLELTPAGEVKFEKYQVISQGLDKKWDGKWRIVAFDIREKRRKSRDLLRIELQDIGFLKMQNSVWVSPYDCGDFIYLLKTDLLFGEELLFFEVDKIENEKYWREKFNVG